MTDVGPNTARRSRRILVPFGTRPEIVKLAPVVAALRVAGHLVTTVHTGQHASVDMSGGVALEAGLACDLTMVLPDELDLRPGQLHVDALRVLTAQRPDLVLVLGDTDTVPAYVLAARRRGVPLAHVEAGLRSFNDRSVEELNRRVATAGASVHFAPTERARSFLLAEGVAPGRIFVVGNSVIDTLRQLDLSPLPFNQRSGILVTAHRPTNVDDPVRLVRLVAFINQLAHDLGPVRLPLHPRTEEKLRAGNLLGTFVEEVVVTPPLSRDAIVEQLRRSRLVVTDSGGLQEEAAYFGIPLVVLRGSTPRWEGVENGSAILASLATAEGAARALDAARQMASPASLARVASLACPYGDGTTSTRIAEILSDPATDELLVLNEPAYNAGELPWTRA